MDFSPLLMVLGVLVLGSEAMFVDTISACLCQCVANFTVTNPETNRPEGNCQSEGDARPWCIVDNLAAQHCSEVEEEPSTGLHKSYDACFTPLSTEPFCEERLTPTHPETEGSCTVFVNGQKLLECYVADDRFPYQCSTAGRPIGDARDFPCQCLDIFVDYDPIEFTQEGMEVSCFKIEAAALGGTLDLTTSAGGLQAIVTKSTWKIRRNCQWTLTESGYACVRTSTSSPRTTTTSSASTTPPTRASAAAPPAISPLNTQSDPLIWSD